MVIFCVQSMIALFKKRRKYHIRDNVSSHTIQYRIHNNSFERDVTYQCRFYDFTFFLYSNLRTCMRNGICSFS